MNFDVVIAGASIAGSYLANILAQRNLKVLILDKEMMPRKKACGEGMAKVGVEYLKRINGFNEILNELNRHPFYGYELNFTDRKKAALHPTAKMEGFPDGYCVGRSKLDAEILAKATTSHRVCFVNENVSYAEKTSMGWRIQAGKNSFNAKFFVAACGTAVTKIFPTINYKVKASQKDERAGLAVWIEGEWDNSTPNSILINNVRGTQFIITPIGERMINLSILCSKKILKTESKNQLISEGLDFVSKQSFKIRNIETIKGSNCITSKKARNLPNGLYLIGDSAEVFDPVGGLGMLHAFTSATLAANSIIRASRNKLIKFEWLNYLFNREIQALKLRFLNFLSYSLNVKESSAIKHLAIMKPNFVYLINSNLKNILIAKPISQVQDEPEQSTDLVCFLKNTFLNTGRRIQQVCVSLAIIFWS